MELMNADVYYTLGRTEQLKIFLQLLTLYISTLKKPHSKLRCGVENCLLALAPVYDPREWGWKLLNDGTYASMWTTLPDVSSHCPSL